MNFKKILEVFGEEAAQATVDCLNKAAADIEKEAKENLRNHGIKGSTMYNAFSIDKATVEKPVAILSVEAYNKKPVKKPGSRTKKMKNRYVRGGYVSLPRLIEFSPRINKPFVYPAYYKRIETIEEEIIKAISEVTANANK